MGSMTILIAVCTMRSVTVGKAEEIFKKIDANSDGGVTLEEFKANRPPRRGGPGGPDGPGKGGKGGGKAGKGGGKGGPQGPPPAPEQ